MKKIMTLLVFALLVVGITACGSSGTTSQTGSSSGNKEVHTSSLAFAPASVTIEKGQSITLINDTAVLHPIENGTWEDNTPKTFQEPGAPTVKVQLNGNDQQTIGPFMTAGTYQLHCTIHPGMNLTVHVQ
ncbi:MAG: plastocyanin/azurin family copper-binding protein [Ktedonobacteraceae bacterium]